jgi:hypothetical protein
MQGLKSCPGQEEGQASFFLHTVLPGPRYVRNYLKRSVSDTGGLLRNGMQSLFHPRSRESVLFHTALLT